MMGNIRVFEYLFNYFTLVTNDLLITGSLDRVSTFWFSF